MSDLGRALLALTAALDRNGISFMVGGSMASGIHGVYRSSLDVDLVVDINPGQIEGFIRELGGGFYADEAMMREALAAGRHFNVIHLASSYKFDIFPLSSDGFQQSQFSRRAMRSIALSDVNLSLPVATAEDTLLMKLSWYRSGGEVSERQWNDVRGIAAVQRGHLHYTYLRQWAAYLRVTDLLELALLAG